MPWLFAKISDFLEEDLATNVGSQSVVVDGILDAQVAHAETVKAKYEREKKAA